MLCCLSKYPCFVNLWIFVTMWLVFSWGKMWRNMSYEHYIESIRVMISLSYGIESEAQRPKLCCAHMEYVCLMAKLWAEHVHLYSSMWNSMALDTWCCALYVEHEILWHELCILTITMKYLCTMWWLWNTLVLCNGYEIFVHYVMDIKYIYTIWLRLRYMATM